MKRFFVFFIGLLMIVPLSAGANDSPLLPKLVARADEPQQAPKNVPQPPASAAEILAEEMSEPAPQMQKTTEPPHAPKVDVRASLTENFSDKNNNDPLADFKKEDTWISKITQVTNPETNDLIKMMEKSRQDMSQKSNASVFDVAGVMLRMTYPQVEAAMLKRGYKKVTQNFEIPNFIKWRNEEKCRNSGVVGYERLNNCVIDIAKKQNYQYVEMSKFAKYDSQEEVYVWFTSNFTKNRVYKIYYKSLTPNMAGSGEKSVYLRNVKVYDFWHQINRKYGNPDNQETVTWGMGGNRPYLQAKTGQLLLEDPMFRELDYTRMSREDQKFLNTGLYNF